MASGLQLRKPQDDSPGSLGGLVVAVAGVLLLLRALPLVQAYAAKLSGHHSPSVIAAAALAGLAAFLLLSFALVRRPRIAAALLGAAALAMTILSGNAVAALATAAILAMTALLGDGIYRLLAGADAGDGDLHAVLAAGAVTAGTGIVVLDLAGLLGAPALAVALALVLAVRMRRIPALLGLARAALRWPRGSAPRGLEAVWLALTAVFLLATWAGVQAPDVSWDGLMYHLPEARDIAKFGRVRVLPDLAPQSSLWKGHDAYVSLAFFAGGESGERIVQFLQCTIGLCVFGAALTLARRIGAGGASPLIVLALAAFPTAMLQLRSTYADWPAALGVTAAAAQLASREGTRGSIRAGRFRLAGFLLGGAVAIKVFALFAVPALLILAFRSRPAVRGIASAALFSLLPLAPWLLWGQLRAGSVTAPYAASPAELVSRLSSGHFFTRSPTTGEQRRATSAASLLRLPYDLVFHSSLFEPNGDGYNGLLPLLLLLGLAGWDLRHNLLFLLAAAPFVVPWSFLFHPSMRFLIPVFPLYVVDTAAGLSRWTRGFSGATGRAAGLAVLAVAAAFPVHFGSTGLEWKAAFGLASREEVIAARLPSAAFANRLRSEDRVLLVGENDRFHIPAGVVWRSEYLPAAGWGRDPEAWRRGLNALGITAVVWRSDRVPFPALESLGDRLVPAASHGPAHLYVVRP